MTLKQVKWDLWMEHSTPAKPSWGDQIWALTDDPRIYVVNHNLVMCDHGMLIWRECEECNRMMGEMHV